MIDLYFFTIDTTPIVRFYWQIMATSTNPELSQKAQVRLINLGG